jgi:hypothetical protein
MGLVDAAVDEMGDEASADDMECGAAVDGMDGDGTSVVDALAAGKRCLVCAPAVHLDTVHGGPIRVCERSGVGLLTEQAGRYVFRSTRKLRNVTRHTFGHDVREVERSGLATFQLLEVWEPVPGPPKEPHLRDADTLAVAVGLIRPVIAVEGEEVQSALGGAAKQRPPGLLSCLTSAGRLNHDGFWQGVAALVTWEGAAALTPPVVPRKRSAAVRRRAGDTDEADHSDRALHEALRRHWHHAVQYDEHGARECMLATANAVAVYVDELLADAVARCHPHKVDPTLPAATGDWLRVAEHLQASLSDMGIENGIRQRLLDMVRKSKLSNQAHLKWKSVKCEAGSFETPKCRKAFAVVCERRWGVPGDEAVDAAMDSAEPRAALIELLVQHQTPLPRAASDIDEVSLQLRQELQGVELTALRQRAASTTGNRRSVGFLRRKSVRPITNATKFKLTASHRQQLKAFKYRMRRSTGSERTPATAYYELPVEYPQVLPSPVTHDMRLRSYKNWHTEVGTTAAWQQHVCAVCNLNNWEREMHTRPFTVRSLMRSICGVPVPAVEWPWDTYVVAAGDNALATELGWSAAIWCGAEAPGEKLCAC